MRESKEDQEEKAAREEEEKDQEEEEEDVEDDDRKESSIQVVVRVRPLLTSEKDATKDKLIVDANTNTIQLETKDLDKTKSKSFQFDVVLDETKGQDDVFERAKVDTIVDAVLEGYDGTIFAYGQTGSGKTYTMEGYQYEQSLDNLSLEQDINVNVNIRGTDSHRLGLVPNTTQSLFQKMEEKARSGTVEFKVRCSYIQLYNERILDLLNPGHLVTKSGNVAANPSLRRAKELDGSEAGGLKMRFNSASNQFFVENLMEVECESPSDLLKQFQKGVKAKIMGSHKLNASSSRSHCLFSIHVDIIDPLQPTQVRSSSRLSLIDLAGSERVSMTGAKGKTLKEATCINKSLFALRNVITAISTAQKEDKPDAVTTHVPFRDSKLTSLLQNSLGGTSLTLMIACISPNDAHADENLSTLAYAAKASKIKNRPTRNEDPKTKLIRKLRAEIRLLRKQLAHAQNMTALTLQKNQQLLTGTSQDSKHQTAPPEEKISHEQLKRELLNSIMMMKKMHEIELELRGRMEEAEERQEYLQLENAQLIGENQRLREHEQVLLHLLDSNDIARPSSSSDNTVKGSVPASMAQIQGQSSALIAKQLLQLRQENEQLRDTVATMRTASGQDNYVEIEYASSPKRRANKTSSTTAGTKTDTKSLALTLSSEVAAVESKAKAKKKKKRKPQVMTANQLINLLRGGSSMALDSTLARAPVSNGPVGGIDKPRASPRRPLLVKSHKPETKAFEEGQESDREEKQIERPASFLPKMNSTFAAVSSPSRTSTMMQYSPALSTSASASLQAFKVQSPVSTSGEGDKLPPAKFPLEGISNLTELLKTQSKLKRNRGMLV